MDFYNSTSKTSIERKKSLSQQSSPPPTFCVESAWGESSKLELTLVFKPLLLHFQLRICARTDLRQGTSGSWGSTAGHQSWWQATELFTFQFALTGLGTITTLKLFHLLTLPRCMCQDSQLAITLFSGWQNPFIICLLSHRKLSP